MKIVYLHQYFVTPEEAGGNRSYYLASKLAERGHDVVVVTSNINRQQWPFVKETNINGFKVIYIKNSFDSRMGVLRRIYSYIRFMFLATFYSARQKNTDLVYASSTPLLIGLPALIVRLTSGAKMVFELRDLWPDVPYELGYLKSKLFFGIIKKFERYVYRKSDLIITISDGITQRVGQEFVEKTRTYPFGCELDIFNLNLNDSWKRQQFIESKSLFVYTGAVGWANGFDLLLDAAAELRVQHPSIHIAVIGTGSALQHVKNRIVNEDITNVSLHSPVSAEQLNSIYNSADGGVILFGSQSETYYQTASPNKFFDYVAAGLPFTYHFGGPLSAEIEGLKLGLKIEKNSPQSMVNNVVKLSNGSSGLLDRCGIREVAETRWNKNEILSNLTKEIEGVNAGSRT